MRNNVVMADGIVGIETQCPKCGTRDVIDVPFHSYKEWRAGKKLVQDALPDLSVGEREALMTGFCEPCWSDVFGLE